MADYNYQAIILRWVDGDTVDLKIDLGFHMTVTDRFRLAGIDTPERGKPGYFEAIERVNKIAPVGSTVEVETFKPVQDKYGRYLAHLYVGPNSISNMLIAEKLAVYYDGGKKGS